MNRGLRRKDASLKQTGFFLGGYRPKGVLFRLCGMLSMQPLKSNCCSLITRYAANLSVDSFNSIPLVELTSPLAQALQLDQPNKILVSRYRTKRERLS